MNDAARRLCERLQVRAPLCDAPMAFVAGGRLAAAVRRAGGMGLVGGGYGDPAWIDEQLTIAHPVDVGVGLITWALGPRCRRCPRTNPLCVKGWFEGRSGAARRRRGAVVVALVVGPGVTSPKSRSSGM